MAVCTCALWHSLRAALYACAACLSVLTLISHSKSVRMLYRMCGYGTRCCTRVLYSPSQTRAFRRVLCCLFVVQPENVFNSLRNEHLIVIPRPPSARGPTPRASHPTPVRTHARARAHACTPPPPSPPTDKHTNTNAHTHRHTCVCLCVRAHRTAPCVRAAGQGDGAQVHHASLPAVPHTKVSAAPPTHARSHMGVHARPDYSQAPPSPAAEGLHSKPARTHTQTAIDPPPAGERRWTTSCACSSARVSTTGSSNSSR